MSDFKLLINGRLVPGDSTMPVLNPATDQPVAECPRGSEAQINAAVAAAKAAFPAWSRTTVEERRAALLKLAAALEARSDEFAELLTQEQGKPLAEAKGEITFTLMFIRAFAEMDLKPQVIEETANARIEAHRRPLGVVACIIPWNFPVLLAAGKFSPALLAGNTLVIKPAATTPLTTLKLGELFQQFFPAGVVNIVTDANDLGNVLTKHPDVRKVSFTGSTATGKKVMASAADTIKRVTLELGGNDAAIVLGDVDPAKTAPALFGAAFWNCGQVCLAVKRLYVHESIYDQMCEELAKLADASIVGNGMEEGVQIGPLQNRAQFEKVKALLAETKAKGGVIAGGQVPDGAGYFIRPTIVRDVKEGDRIVDEEQFGPILPVIKYSDPEDALNRANASYYGLGGSVWGRDDTQTASLAARMEAGTVWINKHLEIAPNVPFGGAKQSGLGVEFAKQGLEEFTQLQVINASRAA
ncbi:MAG: aldehyde dehydrogenase family protein [Nevskia sp.]|nr:aldehyde dehydrogenase family protein [Nevskia sp.]